MEDKKLLELRKKAKKKKPNFIRQNYGKIKSLSKKWRKPKGLQSKLRRRLRGHRKSVSIGYCSPVKIKGYHKSGLQSITIKNKDQVAKLDPKVHGALIAAVGQKKKIELVRLLLEKEAKKKEKEKKESIEEAISEEEKKDQEKKDMDKQLIQTE